MSTFLFKVLAKACFVSAKSQNLEKHYYSILYIRNKGKTISLFFLFPNFSYSLQLLQYCLVKIFSPHGLIRLAELERVGRQPV